jgi:hypothetical protein
MRRDDVIGHTADRQASAAKARRPSIRGLRWQPVPAVPHMIFPRGESLRLAPFLEIGIGPVQQEHPPCFLELGARVVEGSGRAVGALFGQ